MSDQREQNTPPSDDSTPEVFARVTDVVFALDEEWRFTYCNEQAERLLRHGEGELLGTVVWDAFPETVESTFRREFERAMATQEPVTFEAFYPPEDAWFEVRAYPSETGLSVYFRDSTERVRRQTRLQERERTLRRAYEVIADPDRTLAQQIDALLKVVRDAVGTEYATLSRVHRDANTYHFEALVAPDDVELEAGDSVPLEELPNCAHVVETERTLVLKDVEAEAPELADPEWGISCYLGAPVFVGDEVYGTFCFYGMEARTEDFSDWEVTFVELLSKWVSSELERRRQNTRLESFASMLAHELRNPLQIAQLYREQAADGDEAAAEEVAAALDRIDELIDVILVITRGTDSGIDREPVALADAATEAWTDVPGDDAALVVETDEVVEADPIHLRHLFENLFTNAVEHGSTSPRSQAHENAVEHGSTSNRPSADDAVEHGSTSSRSQAHEDTVEHGGPNVTVRVGDFPTGFYVADDGPGIPESEREQVFEAGYTTAEGGIGLGLTFVVQLADTYGWDCRITESDERGTRFEFTGVTFVDED